MALKNVNLWLPEMRSRVQGASDEVLEQQLKAAVRVMAKDTFGYIIHITDKDTVAGKARYYLTPQPEGEVYVIHEIWYNGRPLDVEVTPPKGPTTESDGTPTKVYLEERGVFQFIPTPATSEVDIWDADVSVIPLNTQYVPEDWYAVWFDELFYGALHNCYSMPERPWSSNTQAAFYGRKFRTGISEMRDAIRKKYSNKDVGWTFPDFASP